MHEEDIKNLVGWLQAIYKETQLTRGATAEMRRNIDLIPEIKTLTDHGEHETNDTERKLEEIRNHLEAQIRKLEDGLNEIKHELRDIHSKVDHLK